MSEIKTCPFCGSIPSSEVRVTQMGGGEDHIDFSVKCPECGTEKTVRLKIKGTCIFYDVREAIEKAKVAWNRRADTDS